MKIVFYVAFKDAHTEQPYKQYDVCKSVIQQLVINSWQVYL